MAQQYPTPAAAAAAFPVDALYCSEEAVGLGCFHWQEDFDYEGGIRCSLPLLLEQDLYWEDEELSSLFAKEEKNQLYQKLETNHSLSVAREDAVDWILKVNAHYSFAALTAVLAVNYLDRFLSSFDIQTTEKPWMAQLAAVACLSLAAKVEETQVPLLLDLQVEDSKYLFQAKTIQRMEILVLSTLQWKMNPVTPLSFLDYIARRLGLKDYLCWEFLKRCERIVLSVISDSRSMRYLPSVAATATMLYVFNGVEPCLGTEYQSQLLAILGMSNDEVEECSKLVMELASRDYYYGIYSNKRKFGSMPGSPNAVMDVSFSSDSSNDSWAVASASSSVSSSPEPPLSKKSRAILSLNQEDTSDFLSIIPR